MFIIFIVAVEQVSIVDTHANENGQNTFDHQCRNCLSVEPWVEQVLITASGALVKLHHGGKIIEVF